MEEAKSKRQLEIDVKDISGMTAKQIPEQDNFCDCGLFLLGYVEKFLQNPRDLVNNILQRNLNVEKDWPDMVPTRMRSNIRELLINMGNEQEQARKAVHKEEAKRRGKYHAAEKVTVDPKPRESVKGPTGSTETRPKASAKLGDLKASESKGEERLEKAAERPNLKKEESVVVLSQPKADDEAPSGGNTNSSVEVVITKKTSS